MVNAKELAELSSLAQQLNTKSNNLNGYIEALNQQLAAMNIGLEFYMKHPPLFTSGKRLDDRTSPPTKYEENTYLGWDKLGEKWELTVKEVTTEYQWNDDSREVEAVDSEEYTPLLKASRELRLKAVDHFDDLLETLKMHVKDKLRQLNNAEQVAKLK
ncbi:MAG TPA: hypothetical protein VMI10_09830 [Terriglobales bacterium]|nr:hypothetical protein [Terriglobales bacterium]